LSDYHSLESEEEESEEEEGQESEEEVGMLVLSELVYYSLLPTVE